MAVDPARAKSLFLAASDLVDPAKRAAYLERECGGDAELRQRVEALLAAHEASGNLLGSMPGSLEQTADSESSAVRPGATGAYIGKCPDLITGIHGDDPKKVYADLCQAIEDVVSHYESEGRPLPPPRVRPLQEVP